MRDLLTTDECLTILCQEFNATQRLQAAARLGAERARERFIPKLLAMRDAIIHDDHAEAWYQLYSLADPNPEPGKEPWAEWEQIAAAIRRGEEG